MMFDRETGKTIAELMHQLRPDWDLPGCLSAVSKVAALHPANVAIAAVRLCETEAAKTPMALANREGPHWRERVASGAVLYPPRGDQACPRHPGEWPENCRGCAGDKLAGDVPAEIVHPSRRNLKVADHVGELRHLRAVAIDGFCSHGVDPAKCHEPHPTEPDEQPDPDPATESYQAKVRELREQAETGDAS